MSDPMDPVSVGREVIARESGALGNLRLDRSFAEAISVLEAATGRVIVTGVGKSGLIGAKIAATLTSVGSPAFFLHPTEAIHGDLGIVGKADVVLALSKSGRSAELLQLLPHFKRVGTPIVAVVVTADSPLGKEADVAIEFGPVEEACSLDIVPTTSTTVTLAIGDALAVTLLRRRGLTEEDFVFVHPGGVIGERVTRTVGDLMQGGDRLPRLSQDASLREALVEIVDKGLGVTTLVDASGDLAGILTDGDLKRILLGDGSETALSQPVHTFMSRNPRSVTKDTLIPVAVRLMETPDPGPVTSLVVIEASRPIGIVHLHDCLRS